MFGFIGRSFAELMNRGGLVMWPLLLLSVITIALAFERCWFYLRMNYPGRLARVSRLAGLLRTGQRGEALALAQNDSSVYGAAAKLLLDGPTTNQALAAEAIGSQRHRLERFMPTLSTIITAAPMLGILGTVLGIISSFELLSGQTMATDPRSVSQGIAEALITTAMGLVISLVALFPYNAFRAQLDRTLTRLELLATAAMSGSEKSDGD